MSRIFVKLLGLTGGNKITVPVVHVVYVPLGSDSYITSEGKVYMVKST